jgi:hypothetical protein
MLIHFKNTGYLNLRFLYLHIGLEQFNILLLSFKAWSNKLERFSPYQWPDYEDLNLRVHSFPKNFSVPQNFLVGYFRDLYYKHTTISYDIQFEWCLPYKCVIALALALARVNYATRVMLQIVASLTIFIYDHNIQAIGFSIIG